VHLQHREGRPRRLERQGAHGLVPARDRDRLLRPPRPRTRRAHGQHRLPQPRARPRRPRRRRAEPRLRPRAARRPRRHGRPRRPPL
ncbi:MAG: hypothetical protein AVDCRST_MAG54-1463, partial [uncultured Actinomycetospora sp.]